VEHLIRRWGKADVGGVRYYLMDNEPSIWWASHGDVNRRGTSAAELCDAIVRCASIVHRLDPGALVGGPEEWGWKAFFYSGLDQQWGEERKMLNGRFPERSGPFTDRAARGRMGYAPWLLRELHNREQSSRSKLLDLFTFHFYPTGSEFSDDVSREMQLRRNRSTREL
jgi:hypothetical protein